MIICFCKCGLFIFFYALSFAEKHTILLRIRKPFPVLRLPQSSRLIRWSVILWLIPRLNHLYQVVDCKLLERLPTSVGRSDKFFWSVHYVPLVTHLLLNDGWNNRPFNHRGLLVIFYCIVIIAGIVGIFRFHFYRDSRHGFRRNYYVFHTWIGN